MSIDRKWLAMLLALLLSSFTPADANAQTPQAMADLDFLAGSWDAVGGPPGSSGGTAFRWDAQGRILVRTNHAEYPAMQGRPASRHDDLMVIYVENTAPLRAIYFDNEGHVIRYTASSSTGDTLVLVSEARAGEPRFRLSYSKMPGDRLAGEFASSRPDAPDTFAPMFKWELVRKR